MFSRFHAAQCASPAFHSFSNFEKGNTMTMIMIQPVSTKTSGGFDATITGIDPLNTDCLVGSIITPGAGHRDVSWNLGGICRDNQDSCNLDMRNNETRDVRETAIRIGAK
jgi:hypothetical protein